MRKEIEMKIIKSYMIRTINGRYAPPKKSYAEIELFLKSSSPKIKGKRIRGRHSDFLLEDIQSYKNRIIYYFLEIERN